MNFNAILQFSLLSFKNNAICTGGTAAFTVTASGPGQLSYNWYRGSLLLATHSATLAITNAQPSDSGYYTVDVINYCGIGTSNAAKLVVDVAPQIVKLSADTAACKEKPVTLKVEATGSNLTYQWQKNGAIMDRATSNTYSIAYASPSDSGNYTVLISNACTILASSPVHLTVTNCPPTIHYVKEGGNGNGLSWATASGNLQGMIDSSGRGDEVWVAGGTYKPSATGDQNASFSIPVRVKVYGGFAGTETSLAERSLSETNRSILSGDIGVTGDASDNSYNVIKFSGADNLTSLDGFVVTQASYGGIYIYGDPVISNCSITKNSSNYGGGVVTNYNYYTVDNPTFINCSFTNNSAAYGGAVYIGYSDNESTTSFINCSFSQNQATEGGAIYNEDYGFANHVNLNNCIIWNNAGGGLTSAFDSYSNYNAYNSDIDNGNYNGSDNINQDPLFIDAAYGNLRLQACSPAINAGANSFNATDKDLSGNPRVTGNKIDMGAYEFQGQSGPVSIINMPQTAMVCLGQRAKISVTATGGNLRYQWQKNEVDINGATDSVYSIAATALADAGKYSVIVSGCGSPITSDAAQVTVNMAPAPLVVVTNNCGNSTLTTTASGSLLWSTGATTPSITVSNAGTYTVNQTVNGCISAAGSAVAAPKTAPAIPVVTVINNCGNSTLATTATGLLLWSTGATTPSITVSDAGAYTVTQTINGCASAAGSGVAAPKTAPTTPVINVTNNCGSSTLATTATGLLLWSTGATTPSITVSDAGTYTVTQSVNGCTSAAGSAVATPKSAPAIPVISVTDNCGSSTLATTATGLLLWSTGATTPSITVSNAGAYTVTQTVNGCTSAAGSGVAAPKTAPAIPVVSVTNDCGNSTLTTTATGSLLWSTGATTPSITVSNAGTYTVTQSVNGCTSATGSAVAAPKSAPAIPVVTVTNNCGSSTLATTATGLLLWSTGATTSSITVNTGGSYTVKQTIEGCTSGEGSGTAAPKTAPAAPAVTVTDNCGSSILSTNATGALLWSTGATTSSIIAGNAGSYTVTQIVNGCTSAAGSGTAAPKTAPAAPAVTVTDNCGSSILSTTATGALLWSTGATTSSIIAGNAGSYTVTQIVNGCTSAAGSGTAAPKTAPAAPAVTVTDNCGSSILSTTATGALLWSTGATTSSIIAGNAGSYTVTQIVNGCTSAAGSGTAAPKTAPAAPAVTVTDNCGSSILSTTATGALLWSTGATTSSIIAGNAGSYTVTQTVNGCTSTAGSGTAAPKTALSKPDITANGSTNFCNGGNVILSAPAGFSNYKWSNNATGQTLMVTQSGDYSVVVSNGSCSSPASNVISVTVGNDTQKPVITSPAAVTLCYSVNDIYTIASLQAIDNCSIASTTYTITGATTRSGSSSDASGKFNPGTSTITWTVKDGAGNTSTCQVTVVVNEKFTVAIPDTWAIGSGCEMNTVYKGYIPASLTILAVKVSGGKAPYSYKWSNGACTPVIIINPGSTTTYTVSVRDAKGCTQVATKQIKVVDIRCGSKMDMVSLCYKDKTSCIAAKDVAGYLLKGAYLGSCKPSASKRGTDQLAAPADELTIGGDLDIKAFPNPSTAYFKLMINSSNLKDKVSISILDDMGRVMETRLVFAGQTLLIGDSYRPGIYFVKAVQANKSVSVKLIRQ